MNEFFRQFRLLFLFAVVFSAAACNGQSDNGRANTANGNSAASSKGSEYPVLASAVAQSDLKNLDGSTFKVADRKGEVLLLNLWATWCGPCREEMPALVRMQETHGDKNFKVIGINTDNEEIEKIEPFAEEMKLNYEIVWGDEKIQQSLVQISGFQGIPQSFVIDREGRLRGVFKGAAPESVKRMEDLVAKIVAE